MQLKKWRQTASIILTAVVVGMAAMADGGKGAGEGSPAKTAEETADYHDPRNSEYRLSLAGAKERITFRIFCRSGRFTAGDVPGIQGRMGVAVDVKDLKLDGTRITGQVAVCSKDRPVYQLEAAVNGGQIAGTYVDGKGGKGQVTGRLSFPIASQENIAWFETARLGIGMHWGISSVKYGGPSWPMQGKGGVTKELYEGQMREFKAQNFDPVAWAGLFKKAGVQYFIPYVIDGSGLRQVTFTDPEKPANCDDMDPCYLPNGRIMFASTRAEHAVLCFGSHPVTTMHVVDADGKNLRCISTNTSSEFTPVVLDDGRVLYTRWEYVDKGCGDVQSLWAMRPDGSHSTHVYKNNVAKPPTLIDGREIPGSRRLVATGAPHMPLAVGPIVLIDIQTVNQTPSAMTNITPEIAWPTHGGYPSAKRGFYKEPWPLSEQLFLVAYNPGPNHAASAGYGLYLLDREGNRELIYRDPHISCFQPTPLRPRPTPPVLHSGIDAVADEPPPARAKATLFLQDVYQGMDGIERGRVKYVRVLEDVPKPRKNTGKGGLGLQSPAVSLDGHFTVKLVHGVAAVHEDGSAFFTVPAGRNLYFQALDQDYMELQRMRTFVNLMAGETRSCIGCHELRRQAPVSRPSQAMSQPPQDLSPQPGDRGSRYVHYPLDVQPILDKHCVRCHGGADAKAGLDLSGEPTSLFSKSYEQLLKKRLVDKIDVNPRDALIPAEPPLRFGSHRSGVVQRIRDPKTPCAAPLSRDEFVRLVTWIDANAPFYGTYDGARSPTAKGGGNFRPDPAKPE